MKRVFALLCMLLLASTGSMAQYVKETDHLDLNGLLNHAMTYEGSVYGLSVLGGVLAAGAPVIGAGPSVNCSSGACTADQVLNNALYYDSGSGTYAIAVYAAGTGGGFVADGTTDGSTLRWNPESGEWAENTKLITGLDGTVTMATTLALDTGDEYALDIAYETNKASDGDSYGLRIVHTGTVVPTEAYLISATSPGAPGGGSFVVDRYGGGSFTNTITPTNANIYVGGNITSYKGTLVLASTGGSSTTSVISVSDTDGSGTITFQDITSSRDWKFPNLTGIVGLMDATNVGTFELSESMVAGTGNEIAMNIDYTVNKATSGDDYGLRIAKTETASPGTSYLMWADVAGGNPEFFVQDTGYTQIESSDATTEALRIKNDGTNAGHIRFEDTDVGSTAEVWEIGVWDSGGAGNQIFIETVDYGTYLTLGDNTHNVSINDDVAANTTAMSWADGGGELLRIEGDGVALTPNGYFEARGAVGSGIAGTGTYGDNGMRFTNSGTAAQYLTLAMPNPTGTNTITFPDATGTVALVGNLTLDDAYDGYGGGTETVTVDSGTLTFNLSGAADNFMISDGGTDWFGVLGTGVIRLGDNNSYIRFEDSLGNPLMILDSDGAQDSVAFGKNALGSYAGAAHANAAFGETSLSNITSGARNTAFGYRCLGAGQAGQTYNAGLGAETGYGFDGDYSVLLGADVGNNASSSTSADYEVWIGANTANSGVTGAGLVLVGYNNEPIATSDSYGVSVGYEASPGTNAVALGRSITAPTGELAIGVNQHYVTHRHGEEASTTGTTPDTSIALTLVDGDTYHIKAYVTAYDATGTNYASYEFAGTFYRNGASAAQAGTTTAIHTGESDGTMDATFALSGTDVQVQLTGPVTDTIEWDVTLEWWTSSDG